MRSASDEVNERVRRIYCEAFAEAERLCAAVREHVAREVPESPDQPLRRASVELTVLATIGLAMLGGSSGVREAHAKAAALHRPRGAPRHHKH